MRCRCGVYVLCFANLTLSYKASKNLETFQETSSRLPGTPLPAVTGLVVGTPKCRIATFASNKMIVACQNFNMVDLSQLKLNRV